MWRRRTAIWGTGNVCLQILNENVQADVAFFIDNDKRKADKILNGRKIIHPSQIKNWKGIYIIIAIDNYNSVKGQLIRLGLQEQLDFIWYRDWMFPSGLDQIIKEAEQFLSQLETQKKYKGCKLIFSDFPAFDKGVCEYVNKWNMKEKNLVLLSEVFWLRRDKKIRIPVVHLPAVLAHNQYLKCTLEKIDKKILNYVEMKWYLKEAAVNLRMGYPNMSEKYEYVVCYYADQIVREIIRSWKPLQIILWNAFYAFHMIIRNICSELDIPVKYMEFGNIPGTIIIEDMGQMGESWPAKYPSEFLKIPVSEAEYVKARQLVNYLYQTKLNRNIQPQNDLLSEVWKKINSDRPVVFYAGQNDNASGMQPYTENTKKFHSPIFISSDEAALFLAQVCQKNGWNYIYKPHPMMVENCRRSILPDDTILVDNVDINNLIDMSDVIVTILSTVSYIALIRQKPTVMLGYTQLKGKGCTYEAFKVDDIEMKILEALKDKMTPYMKNRFINHVVQLKKYYPNFMEERNEKAQGSYHDRNAG